MPHLRLNTLGPPETTLDDLSIKYPTRKARALLLYLAVEGRVEPRTRLLTLFFPESDNRRGRAALRSTIAYLRRALNGVVANGSEMFLQIDADTAAFNFDADISLDLHIFNAALALDEPEIAQLEEASTLYRGDFLEGFSLPDALEFDDWLTLQQERWHQRMSLLLDRLAQLQIDGHHLAGAVVTATRWTAHDPLNELAYHRLMMAHGLMGNRTTALQVYAQCCGMLDAELGAPPSPEIVHLAERIRLNQIDPQIFTQRLTATIPQQMIPFVGRAVEHSQMVAAYRLIQQGQMQVVVIEGEAGIGKTRLAEEFCRHAHLAGADLLRAHAFEAGGRLPYQPIVEALRPQLEAENAPDDLLDDVWLGELSRILPELRARYPDLLPLDGDDDLARTRLPEAVARLVQKFSKRGPLVFFIDDIQWGDAGSLDLLHYVCRVWSAVPTSVLLLLTVRSEAFIADPQIREWMAGLERSAPVKRLLLDTISSAETHQLLHALASQEETSGHDPAAVGQWNAPPADFAQWLYRETAGHPFFISETLKALQERGIVNAPGEADHAWVFGTPPISDFLAPTIRQLILSRLQRLSETATRLLNASAVLGRPCTFERMCNVAGVPEDRGLGGLEELLQRQLLLETAERSRLYTSSHEYTFSHDKIRDVVYTEAGDARRRVYHRRAFEELEAWNAPAAELAHHALEARLLDPAFRYALAAGDDALKLFALRDAIAHYEQARSILDEHRLDAHGSDGHRLGTHRFDEHQQGTRFIELDVEQQAHLYTRLGRVYEHLGDYQEAQSICNELLSLARATSNRALEIDALNRLAAQATYTHQLERATDLLKEASTVAEESSDVRRLAEIEWSLAQAAHHRNEMEESKTHALAALALARELEDPELIAGTLNSLAYACLYLGEVDACVDYMEEARIRAQKLGNRAQEADCMVGLAAAYSWSGEPRRALEYARTGYVIAGEIESLWGQIINGVQVTLALSEIGEYTEALAIGRKNLDIARPHKGALLLITAMATGTVLRLLGNYDEARRIHLEMLAVAEESGISNYLAMTAVDLCADAALSGDWETAYTHAQQALAHRDYRMVPLRYVPNWTITEALLRHGDVAAVRLDLQRSEQIVGHIPRFRLDRLRSLSLLSAWEGDLPQAVTHLEDALMMAKNFGLPAEVVQISQRLAALRHPHRASQAT